VLHRGTILGTGEVLWRRDILKGPRNMAWNRSRRLWLKFLLSLQHDPNQLLGVSYYFPITGMIARLVYRSFNPPLLHCHSVMSHSSHATKPAQIIEGEYLDPQKLMQLLSHKYGPSNRNNFRVELRLNRYQIYPPQGAADAGGLTEAQIKACRAYSRLRY